MCSRIGTIVKHQNGKATVIKLSCRSWSCEKCQIDRKRSLIAEVKEGKPQRLITLTVNPNWFDDPQDRAERLVKAWRLIRRRFLKLHPSSVVEFMAIFERTQQGEPHLHIVQRGAFMSQRWLSRQLEELIGAKIVDIRMVRNPKHVAWYVAKYIGKEPYQFGTLKRYWRSKLYLPMSKAKMRKIRNAGARFYIMDCHWKGYLKQCTRQFGHENIHARRNGFSFALDDDEIPPWCLCIDPIVCAELEAA